MTMQWSRRNFIKSLIASIATVPLLNRLSQSAIETPPVPLATGIADLSNTSSVYSEEGGLWLALGPEAKKITATLLPKLDLEGPLFSGVFAPSRFPIPTDTPARLYEPIVFAIVDLNNGVLAPEIPVLQNLFPNITWICVGGNIGEVKKLRQQTPQRQPLVWVREEDRRLWAKRFRLDEHEAVMRVLHGSTLPLFFSGIIGVDYADFPSVLGSGIATISVARRHDRDFSLCADDALRRWSPADGDPQSPDFAWIVIQGDDETSIEDYYNAAERIDRGTSNSSRIKLSLSTINTRLAEIYLVAGIDHHG